MKFSQRMGFEPVKSVIQADGINDELRHSIWNVLDLHIWTSRGFQQSLPRTGPKIRPFSQNLWFNYFKKPLDTIPEYSFEIMRTIRAHFYDAPWYKVYDFVEFVVAAWDDPQLESDLNSVLESELSGFRVIHGVVTPVTDEAEVEALEKALSPSIFTGVEIHLKQALSNLSNKENPDFRNSIKESISAVESLACELTGSKKATLGDALKTLEKEGQLHGSLKAGFSKIYGYTSDADGIRHAILDETKIDINDAKYFLVSCAAFINYLKSKHAK